MILGGLVGVYSFRILRISGRHLGFCESYGKARYVGSDAVLLNNSSNLVRDLVGFFEVAGFGLVMGIAKDVV